MPPFAKFRGHRRNGSNQGSPVLNSPDSPHQLWENDSAIPSHNWRIPSLSPENGQENSEQLAPSAILRAPADSPDKTTFTVHDRPRAMSSSSGGSIAPRPFPPPLTNPKTTGPLYESREPILSGFSEQARFGGEPRFVSRLNAPHGSERANLEDMEPSKNHHSAVPKASKTKLNLLNPMSLLARRRSSQQGIDHKADGEDLHVNSLAVPAIPEDYDPRIRGKIVHDFSKPRPRKNFSGAQANFNGSHAANRHLANGQIMGRANPPGKSGAGSERNVRSPEHAPMFKEHFNDDVKTLSPGSTGYLQSLAIASIRHPEHDPPPVPAFARNLPIRLPIQDEKPLPEPPNIQTREPNPSSASPAVRQASKGKKVSSSPRKSPSPGPPLSQSAMLKHTKSTSSRFSFQLSGGGSVQEKLLEENYKLKEANRKAQTRESVAEEDEDDFENYDFNDDNAFEERIPGINADAEDEDGFEEAVGINAIAEDDDSLEADPRNVLDSFSFTPNNLSVAMSPTTTDTIGQTSQATPRDEHGRAIGFAFSKTSPLAAGTDFGNLSIFENAKMLDGLGIMADPISNENTEHLQHNGLNDDDMYFDDGFIADVPSVDGNAPFDETIFDDETGRIRDIPAQNAARLAGAVHSKPALGHQSSLSSNKDSGSREASSTNQTSGLTQGNLEAFHNALVNAASKAAAEDRFAGNTLDDEASEKKSDPEARSNIRDSGPGLTSDDSQISPNVNRSTMEDFGDDYNLDDDLEDDAIIAEANAEVLENDDEGFYGQEFGFYARAHSKSNSDLVHGGFFGPRGIDTMHRSHSGKANFQEPSLTPITERSEWSHRNSLASLHALGISQSAQSLPSPALANLIEIGALDEDLSLDALMRLRRGAWGGSQSSLHSATSHNSSPVVSQMPSHPLSAGHNIDHTAPMGSSVYSLNGSAGILEFEEEEDRNDAHHAMKTTTQNAPKRKRSEMVQSPDQLQSLSSPFSQPLEAGGKGHSRQSSGAESVSYSRDPDGSGRWMLERRRTGDDGETEVIGREFLSGGI